MDSWEECSESRVFRIETAGRCMKRPQQGFNSEWKQKKPKKLWHSKVQERSADSSEVFFKIKLKVSVSSDTQIRKMVSYQGPNSVIFTEYVFECYDMTCIEETLRPRLQDNIFKWKKQNFCWVLDVGLLHSIVLELTVTVVTIQLDDLSVCLHR